MNQSNEKKWFQKWWVWAIIVLSLGSVFSNKNNDSPTNKNNTSSSSSNDNSCYGTESCIDNVRQNFTNTGKQILSEQYLSNGKFGISFLDPSRGQTYNSEVLTDCNCKILNATVRVMR